MTTRLLVVWMRALAGAACVACAGSSTNVSLAVEPAVAAVSDAVFPLTWQGRWKGPVEVLGGGNAPKFDMELIIGGRLENGRTAWNIVYDGAAGRQVRPYELVVKDEATGAYTIDEKNGIELPVRYLGGAVHSVFEVQGTRITTRYELLDAEGAERRIQVELTSYKVDAATTSGGGEVPEVLGWQPVSVQRAVLRPVEQEEKGAAPRLSEGEKTKAEQSKAEEPKTVGGRAALPASETAWSRLATEAYRGKQDDIFFVTPTTGWYVNGAGKIFKTTDSGATWVKQLEMPGTYFRCVVFLDEQRGFAGNIGPGYFPNVTDEQPLYATTDGGTTWTPVTTIEGAPVVGLCALEVVREPFVNAGNLEHRQRIVGVGRVGGPAAFIYSDDDGKTWKQLPLPEQAAMAFDVHFFDFNHGLIASASDANVQAANATALATDDGGKSWREVYRSPRPFEISWKMSFPSRETGYLTVQSYNPDPKAAARFVAKTVDGGRTWGEIPLVEDAGVRQFGVAFVNDRHGWVGAMPGGFETLDGGATWRKAEFGNAVNKIRVLRDGGRVILHAIGVHVHRLELAEEAAK